MNKTGFKRAVEAYYKSNINVKGVKMAGDSEVYVAKVDWGSFEECITLCPRSQYRDYDTVALSFKVQNYPYPISIYDLICFIGDNDYNVYTFNAFMTENSLTEVFRLYETLTDKYYSYLKAISSDAEMQERMTQQLIENLNLDVFKDELDFEIIKREELDGLKDIEDAVYAAWGYVEFNNGKRNVNKVIKKFEKKYELLSVYEKRVLQYLKAGGELPKPVLKFGASYKSYLAKMWLIIAVISVIPVIFCAVKNYLLYSDGFIPPEQTGISVAFISIIFVLSEMAGLFFLASRLIMRIIAPKDLKKDFDERLKCSLKRGKSEGRFAAFYDVAEQVAFYIVGFVLVVFGLSNAILFEGIAFYDDYVKMEKKGTVYELKYEDVDFYSYSVEGDVSKSDYVLVFGDNEFFIITNVDLNSETRKKIFEKATEVKRVNSFEDIGVYATE